MFWLSWKKFTKIWKTIITGSSLAHQYMNLRYLATSCWIHSLVYVWERKSSLSTVKVTLSSSPSGPHINTPNIILWWALNKTTKPFLLYLGKLLMIHFNKVGEGRWIGMIFIPRFHNIYCLSFHLKYEGMDYIVDNFKSSMITGVTNMIMEKIRNILVCPKKCLSKCKDK